jgi:hypothetical protein
MGAPRYSGVVMFTRFEVLLNEFVPLALRNMTVNGVLNKLVIAGHCRGP